MSDDLLGRIASLLLAAAIFVGLGFRLRRGWIMLFGKPKSDLDQLHDELDDMKRLDDPNREI